MLPHHVERMVTEREELSEKVTKLEEFILNNPVFWGTSRMQKNFTRETV